jgi:hypothetical protein
MAETVNEEAGAISELVALMATLPHFPNSYLP